jgi:site-specific recombinase XerD
MTDPTLRAVIGEFVAAAGTVAERRERRAALSHVDAGLGTMPIRSVRTRNLAALLDDLYEAGLSARREAAVVDALHSLYAFAIARGLVADDPTPGGAAAATPAPMPAPATTPATTPTLTMLALGARAAVWAAWTIGIVFALLLVALVNELA